VQRPTVGHGPFRGLDAPRAHLILRQPPARIADTGDDIDLWLKEIATHTGHAHASLLFGVQPTDPAVAGAVAAIQALVALVAIALPARRAAKVNPAAVLNS